MRTIFERSMYRNVWSRILGTSGLELLFKKTCYYLTELAQKATLTILPPDSLNLLREIMVSIRLLQRNITKHLAETAITR